jgi:adenylylsulfate kinase
MGAKLVTHGITVIFDATASRREYRDLGRRMITRFMEVSVECPLDVCMRRDDKGTYRKGQQGESSTVPGLQVPYEAPLNPEVRIDTTQVQATVAAPLIMKIVKEKFLSCA